MEQTQHIHEGIAVNATICHGKPCVFDGHRDDRLLSSGTKRGWFTNDWQHGCKGEKSC